MENMVEYYVDDDLSLSPEVDHESLRMQYRQIWELRATLEEDEELSDPGAAVAGAAAAPETPGDAKFSDAKFSDAEVESQISPSSPDQSPDVEAPTSHTTSFESNTEPLLEDSWGRWGAGAGAALQLPSYETRRQTYRNVLSWRLRHLESRRHQVTGVGAGAGAVAGAGAGAGVAASSSSSGRQPSIEDTSFDSVETADTEASSTDASRLEQATTSFESTTDNTDSAGDGGHRLQQLRADSGYRSLEQAPAPPATIAAHAPSAAARTHPRVPRRQMPVADSTELEAPRDFRAHRLPSLGDSGSADGAKSVHLALGESAEREHDEGVAGLCSPPAEAPAATHATPSPAPSAAEGRRRACARSASKKRREFGGGRGGAAATAAVLANDAEPPPPPAALPALPLLHRCHAVYTRDYSVDEKSDALFREFSRCEPPSVSEALRPRLGGAHRRHAAHHRHAHLAAAAAAYPYARKAASAAAAVAAAAAVPACVAHDKGLAPDAGPAAAAAAASASLAPPAAPTTPAAAAAAVAAAAALPLIRVGADDPPERMC